MISLAARAGNVVSGEFATEKAIQKMKARLVIVSTDASDNTVKKFTDKCDFYKIPIYIYGTKESLAHAMGRFNFTAFRACAHSGNRQFVMGSTFVTS